MITPAEQLALYAIEQRNVLRDLILHGFEHTPGDCIEAALANALSGDADYHCADSCAVLGAGICTVIRGDLATDEHIAAVIDALNDLRAES